RGKRGRAVTRRDRELRAPGERADEDSRPDGDLVDAVNGGDLGAFETLYSRYRDWVVSLAWRFTRNHDDALDVLQETFAYFLRKFPGFRLEARLTTFFYPVVRHLSYAACDRRRRFSAEGADLAKEKASSDPPPGEETPRAELEELLDGLSDAHREVIVLRFIDDLSLEEIAVAQGVPLGTVKSRLHHAVAALRENPRLRRFFEAT
ncbi:MAG TPA: sigma-70 family RNA polymerase sigma factor, partial [Planctomycetota bacterium]|nr:sigma-70 family RNA polymerase sigma factor [Planctomycetota bacterium]